MTALVTGITVTVVALLAWDVARRWIKHVRHQVQDTVDALSAEQDRTQQQLERVNNTKADADELARLKEELAEMQRAGAGWR